MVAGQKAQDMTPDELIDVVGQAYGEPTDDIAEALFDYVHTTYDQTDSEEGQLKTYLRALGRIQQRIQRVVNAVAELHDTAPIECEDLPY